MAKFILYLVYMYLLYCLVVLVKGRQTDSVSRALQWIYQHGGFVGNVWIDQRLLKPGQKLHISPYKLDTVKIHNRTICEVDDHCKTMCTSACTCIAYSLRTQCDAHTGVQCVLYTYQGWKGTARRRYILVYQANQFNTMFYDASGLHIISELSVITYRNVSQLAGAIQPDDVTYIARFFKGWNKTLDQVATVGVAGLYYYYIFKDSHIYEYYLLPWKSLPATHDSSNTMLLTAFPGNNDTNSTISAVIILEKPYLHAEDIDATLKRLMFILKGNMLVEIWGESWLSWLPERSKSYRADSKDNVQFRHLPLNITSGTSLGEGNILFTDGRYFYIYDVLTQVYKRNMKIGPSLDLVIDSKEAGN